MTAVLRVRTTAGIAPTIRSPNPDAIGSPLRRPVAGHGRTGPAFLAIPPARPSAPYGRLPKTHFRSDNRLPCG